MSLVISLQYILFLVIKIIIFAVMNIQYTKHVLSKIILVKAIQLAHDYQ